MIVSLRRRALTAAAVAATAFTALTATSAATSSSVAATAPVRVAHVAPVNPIAAGPWGVYTGGADGIYPAWQQATGTTKSLLAKIALRPRVRWFGSWISTSDITSNIASYISQTQNGNPSVLVQMAMFRLWPHGEGALKTALTPTEQAQYRGWVNAAARGIGSARVAIVVEPDLALSRAAAGTSIRYALARYAAQTFGALPHATVYLDGAAGDWLTPVQAAQMLQASGIRYIRGFALNATHYASTESNDVHGAAVVAALAHLGLPGKHFVVNTADTGQPFTWLQYWAAHPHGNFDNAQTCATRSSVRCVTLGILPTSNVAAAKWHLSAAAAKDAQAYCDGYLWFGRPWLDYQAAPYDQARALQIARTTPF